MAPNYKNSVPCYFLIVFTNFLEVYPLIFVVFSEFLQLLVSFPNIYAVPASSEKSFPNLFPLGILAPNEYEDVDINLPISNS